MVSEAFSSFPLNLADFHPCPPASQRKRWEELSEESKQRLLATNDEFGKIPFPTLSASLFMEFSRVGNRTNYEQLYFTKRKALNAAVLVECSEHKQNHLDRIIDGIYSICEESAWQLPAHNSLIRDGIQLILPDVTHPVVDLFACETAAQLATVHYLLKTELNQVSPLICTRIEEEITKRVLAPYLAVHFWWMGKKEEKMCNWTTWCTQNVLLAAFLLPTSQEQRRTIVKQALYSLDCFLKDYGEDGCCNEGAQYYHHAGLCLFHALSILNEVGKGACTPLFSEPKICNIATYIKEIHAQGPYFINFADCSPLAGQCTAREYLFAKQIGDEQMMRFALHSFQSDDRSQRDLPQEINLYYRLLALFHEQEMEMATAEPEVQDIYYPSVGVLITRDDTYVLAVKAGGNGDSHNHNDTGSLTVYKRGEPLLIDIGVESYTKKTFSSERYSLWTMQSLYHNVTNFPPLEQLPGEEYQATEVEINMQKDPYIRMELASAYPKDTSLHSYRRKVTHRKGTCILLEETLETERAGVLTLMTKEKPLKGKGKIEIGESGVIRITNQEDVQDIQFESIPIKDERLRETWPSMLYRILITYTHHLLLEIE